MLSKNKNIVLKYLTHNNNNNTYSNLHTPTRHLYTRAYNIPFHCRTRYFLIEHIFLFRFQKKKKKINGDFARINIIIIIRCKRRDFHYLYESNKSFCIRKTSHIFLKIHINFFTSIYIASFKKIIRVFKTVIIFYSIFRNNCRQKLNNPPPPTLCFFLTQPLRKI